MFNQAFTKKIPKVTTYKQKKPDILKAIMEWR